MTIAEIISAFATQLERMESPLTRHEHCHPQSSWNEPSRNSTSDFEGIAIAQARNVAPDASVHVDLSLVTNNTVQACRPCIADEILAMFIL
jgi:hypothetical protein